MLHKIFAMLDKNIRQPAFCSSYRWGYITYAGIWPFAKALVKLYFNKAKI